MLAMSGIVLSRGQARISLGQTRTPIRSVSGGPPTTPWVRAKQGGRDRVEESALGVERAVTETSAWERLALSLISSNGMVAGYRPIVKPTTTAHVGYEALSRAAHRRPVHFS
jgi:hypothetical protein